MTRFPKILALLAFLVAAGCRDSFPDQVPAEGIVYYPVGLAVRQLPPTPASPAGSSQLAIVSSNFDLRYAEQTGGTVQIVDPDASQDTAEGGTVSLYANGFLRIGSFGGQVALADLSCPPGWPSCPSACPQLASDPVVADGGAKLLVASRSLTSLYVADMSRDGALTCDEGCVKALELQYLDPYGVEIVCNSRGGEDRADAMFTHLAGVNGQGWLSRVGMAQGTWSPIALGVPPTYGLAYDRTQDLLYVSGVAQTFLAPLRWMNPSVTNATSGGFEFPTYVSASTTTVVAGSVARAIGVSNDGLRLFVSLILYDADILLSTGTLVSQGGALAVYSIARTGAMQPALAILDLVPTCAGRGDLKVLPPRPGKGDLVAMTCDQQGVLVLYDEDLGDIARYIGLDPDTGLPLLGVLPWGIAVEPIDPARAITSPSPNGAYQPSPCVPGKACTRMYVGSFKDNWINILELVPDEPEAVALVKRIGRGP